MKFIIKSIRKAVGPRLKESIESAVGGEFPIEANTTGIQDEQGNEIVRFHNGETITLNYFTSKKVKP